MLSRLAILATSFASVLGVVNGPSSLYSRLNGLTFNPPGYTIVMYQSCMQNQNQGNPCGSFSGFQTSGGQYTHMLYGPEAPVSPTCSRTFRLSFACGPTLQMSGVNENPTCVYSATLTMPEACGVDMTVGNEAASTSVTPPPASPSSSTTRTLTPTPTGTTTGTSTGTGTASNTGTPSNTPSATQSLVPSATSTSLFVVTAYPTPTSTKTLTATSTPLYMITAWPTPSSAFNSTATATPLFYLTPYPSYDPTNGTMIIPPYITDLLNKTPPNTAMILGGVAVGIVGIVAVAYAVRYMRNGGTLKGLAQTVMANRGKLGQLSKALPLSPEMRRALERTEAGMDKAAAVANDPSALLDQLPVSQSMKDNLKRVAPKGNVYDMMEAAQNPAELRVKALEHFKSIAPSGAGALVDQLPIDAETKRKIQALTQKQLTALTGVASVPAEGPVVNITVTRPDTPPPHLIADVIASAVASVKGSPILTATPAEVILQVKAEDLAEVQAVLAAKRLAEAQNGE